MSSFYQAHKRQKSKRHKSVKSLTRKATNPYISVKENTSVNIDFDRKQKVMTKNKKNCTQITDFETM